MMQIQNFVAVHDDLRPADRLPLRLRPIDARFDPLS